MAQKIFVTTVNIAFKCDETGEDAASQAEEHLGRMISYDRDRTFVDWEYAQQMNEEGNLADLECLDKADPDADYDSGEIFNAARGEGKLIGGDTSGPLLLLIKKMRNALDMASSFINGFSDDDSQEDMDFADDVDDALSEANEFLRKKGISYTFKFRVGDEVYWTDPGDGLSSGIYKVVSCSDIYNDDETIYVINNGSSEAEVYERELS